jgi:hypothetical protein
VNFANAMSSSSSRQSSLSVVASKARSILGTFCHCLSTFGMVAQMTPSLVPFDEAIIAAPGHAVGSAHCTSHRGLPGMVTPPA